MWLEEVWLQQEPGSSARHGSVLVLVKELTGQTPSLPGNVWVPPVKPVCDICV